MPRPRTHTRESLAGAAMTLFWNQGYEATSMDDLVRATGVSRHGIYSDFGGKHELFVAGFAIYQQSVVTPAFAPVEQSGAGLDAVAAYFETQIARAESLGLPGPGCLVANTTTETSAHDAAVLACIDTHLQRLHDGFANVLRNSGVAKKVTGELATAMVTFTQGLWCASRVTDDAETLRRAANTFLELIQSRSNQ